MISRFIVMLTLGAMVMSAKASDSSELTQTEPAVSVPPAGSVASYTVTDSLGFQSKKKSIELWMSQADRVLLYPQQQVAEHWRRDEHEKTTFTRHFISAERSVFYPHGALRSLQLPSEWQSVGKLISPSVIATLPKVTCPQSEAMRNIVSDVSMLSMTCYQGKWGKQTIDVMWLDEEDVPAYLKIAGDMKRYEYRLTALKPWQPTHTRQLMDWKRFLSTDYADVADDAVDDPFWRR